MRTLSIFLATLILAAITAETSFAQSGRDRMERRLAMKNKMMDGARHPGMHTKRYGQGGMHVRGRADRR